MLNRTFITVEAEIRYKYTCEGDDISRWIECSNIEYGIQIESAKYGRATKDICAKGRSKNDTLRNCPMENVYYPIASICDGKTKCDSFIVSDKNFATTSCEDVFKYVTLRYECCKSRLLKILRFNAGFSNNHKTC